MQQHEEILASPTGAGSGTITPPPCDFSSSSTLLLSTTAAIKTATTKDLTAFRNYTNSSLQARVEDHYRNMRLHQTVEFYRRMEEKYSFADGHYRAKMTIREAFTALESYVDSSDPDLSLPNLVHMLQTAEGIRKAGHPDWFQVGVCVSAFLILSSLSFFIQY